MTGWRTLENTAPNKLNIVLVVGSFFLGSCLRVPRRSAKDPLHIERSWAALTSLEEFHNKLCSQGSGMMGVDEGEGFLGNMFKIKTKSCVMLLLRHAAGHLLSLIDDALCVGEGVELGKMPAALQIDSSHLSAVVLSPQVTEKLLEVENETMMKVADLEKVLIQKDKDLIAIRVSLPWYNDVILLCLPRIREASLHLCVLAKIRWS